MSDQNDLLDLLGEVNNMLEGTPEGAEVFRQLRAGELTADDAVRQLADIARNAGLLGQLEDASKQVTALVPDAGTLTPEALANANRPVKMKTSTGIDQLNPLYEGAIAERVALDGDAPELRSGPLPLDEAARPAVPVKTTSRNPVVIGLMLERASNEVKKVLTTNHLEHRSLCQRLLADAEETAQKEGRDVTTALELTKKKLPPIPTGTDGYEAGQLPALREVEPPSPHVAAVMTPELQRLAIFKVIATTQGRRSVAPVIETGVREILEREGIPLADGFPFDIPVFNGNKYPWAIQVFGPDDLHEEYNPIQAAIEALAAQCLVKARAITNAQTGEYVHPEGGWAVTVVPYDGGIANRRFGWVVLIGPKAEL